MYLHDAVVACHLHACVDIRHGARADVTVATETVDPAVSQFAAGHDEWHCTRAAAERGEQRVEHDIVNAIVCQQAVILVQLNLSTAFDTAPLWVNFRIKTAWNLRQSPSPFT